jgi:hypothetical protein
VFDGRGGGLVIPCMAGVQQGLKGSGLGGRGGYPGKLWDRLQAGVLCRLVVRILVVVVLRAQPRGRYSGMVWVWQLEASVGRVVYPTVCGSGTGLWPGTAQGAESRAEQSIGSADLCGGDLACQLLFY